MPFGTFALFFSSSLGFCVCSSLLIRSFHRLELEEWKASGEPIPGWWAPKGKRGELILGAASASQRAGFRYIWYLVLQNPEWLKKEGREKARLLQLACRVFAAVALVGILTTFLGFDR